MGKAGKIEYKMVSRAYCRNEKLSYFPYSNRKIATGPHPMEVTLQFMSLRTHERKYDNYRDLKEGRIHIIVLNEINF